MLIASASTEILCHVWANGSLQNTYTPAYSSKPEINSISWGKDGSWMVLVPKSGKAEIVSFNETSVKSFGPVHGIQYPTCACFQNTTKKYIAVGTTTGQLLMYDVKTKTIKKKFPHAPSSIFKVEYCVKDTHVIAGCDNGEIFMYNNNSTNLSGTFKVPNSRTLTNFRCHPFKRNLVGGCSEEGIVAVWDINTSKCTSHIQAHSALVKDIAFSKTRSDLIVSLGMDRRMCFYDTLSNKIATDIATQKTPTAIDFAADGVSIAVGFSDGRIEAYDTRNIKENFTKFQGHKSQVNQILFEKNVGEKGSEISIHEETHAAVGILDKEESLKSNSYGHMFCGDYLPDIKESDHETSTQNSVADSFIDAIGLNSLNGSQSFNQIHTSLGTSLKQKTKQNLIDISVQSATVKTVASPINGSPSFVAENTVKSNYKTQVNQFIKTQLASTPNSVEANSYNVVESKALFTCPTTHAGISPIPKPEINATNKVVVVDEPLKETIKNIVRDELEKFGKDVITWELGGAIRKHVLDIQMSLARLHVNVEDNIEQLREELTRQNVETYDEFLLQENIRLRAEVAMLRSSR